MLVLHPKPRYTQGWTSQTHSPDDGRHRSVSRLQREEAMTPLLSFERVSTTSKVFLRVMDTWD